MASRSVRKMLARAVRPLRQAIAGHSTKDRLDAMGVTTEGSIFARRSLPYRDTHLTISGMAEDHYFRTAGVDAFFQFVLDRSLPQGATILDVGANIGLTAVVAATVSKGRVFAFEPGPTIYACLLETLKANPGLDVIPVNLGLGAVAGQLSFFDDVNNPSGSHMITRHTCSRASDHRISVTTIDQFVSDRGLEALDLVKIDVEGFEIDVLRGGFETIATLKPAVFLEFNAYAMIAFRNVNPREMLSLLSQTFPYLYRYVDKQPRRIASEADVLDFLHDNLSGQGCVDDLYGAFSPL